MKYWTTAAGEKIHIHDLDHQHLSNILWFLEIFWDLNSCNSSSHRTLKLELDSRFGGNRLDWKPLPIPGEVRKIKELCLVDNSGRIWKHGKCIGTVSHIESWRNL